MHESASGFSFAHAQSTGARKQGVHFVSSQLHLSFLNCRKFWENLQGMKGVVFTEFLEMVEQKFGMEMVNALIENNDLSSDGVYSAVGTYHHSEMVSLVVDLGKRSGITIPDLLKAFGAYLFQTFQTGYPEMFANATNGFEFLQSVDQEIHVEVLKLYPDAELPSFRTELLSEHVLQMDYRSDRAMGALAHGLIEACGEHYNEGYQIDFQPQTEDGKHVRFVIEKSA